MWAAVMTELGMIRPLARVEKEMSLVRLPCTDPRWAAVMGGRDGRNDTSCQGTQHPTRTTTDQAGRQAREITSSERP